jgi:chromosome segregation ATPase
MRQIAVISILLAICTFLFAGCQISSLEFSSQDDIKKEVLENDPSFTETLAEKAKFDEQINKLRQEFNSKKDQINLKVQDLKKELNSAKKNADEKIKQIYSQLDPAREALRLKIKDLSSELRLIESSLSTTKKTIEKFSKLAQQDAASQDAVSAVQKWQDKITPLRQQQAELESDAAQLRGKIRQNQLKLKLLK